MTGLTSQYAAVDDNLTGVENRELIERLDLTDTGRQPAATSSGGMRGRLDLAEPATGAA